TFTATDECTNSVSTSSTITLTDNVPPTASNPLPINVECAVDLPGPDITVVTDEADNCTSNPVVAHVSDVSDGGFNPEVITRTYSITDDCGNSINVEQIITIDDITPPDAQCQPLAIQLDAAGNASITIADINNGSSDNCTADEDLVFALDKTDFTCSDLGTNNVVLTVTDEHGNASTCTAAVTVEDNIDPTITCLSSYTATGSSACSGTINVAAPVYDDNCGVTAVNWTMTGDTNDSGSGAIGTYTFNRGTTTILYTVNDAAGNENQCSYQITVPDRLTTTATASATVTCSGDDLTLSATPSGGTANYLYSWTGPNGFNSSQPNPVINNITTAVSGSYSVVVTDANGCTATASVSVTVRPTPTATISGTTEVCQNDSPLPAVTIRNPMDLPVTVTYTINNTGLTTVNIAAHDEAIVSQATSSAGDFAYRLESVGYSSGPACTHALNESATITVHPTPTVNAITDKTYCYDSNVAPIVFSGSVPGTTFEWTSSNPAIGLGSTNGTGNLPSFTTTNAGSSPISSTITVTPYANGCEGNSETFTITVRPELTASISVDNTQACMNTPSPIATFTNPLSLPVTITYTRNGSPQTIDVSANGTATVAVPTTTAGTFVYELGSVAFQTTPSCSKTITGSVSVVVNPIPTASVNRQSQSICTGETIDPIVITGNPAGTTFTWTRDNVSGVPTDIASSDSGNTISGSLTNTGSSPLLVTFTITPTYNGCPGTPEKARVIVNPKPVATATPALQSRCSGVAFSQIVLDSETGGTTYSWTRDNTSAAVGVAESGTGNINGTLVNTTNEPLTVTFTITPTANDCVGDPITAQVLLNPKPDIDDLTEAICNSGTFEVSPEDGVDGEVPTGTSYKWSIQSSTGGISGAKGDSAATITGTLSNTTNIEQYVVYSVTPFYGACRGEVFTLTVTVTPEPAIDDMTANQCSGVPFNVSPANNTNGIVPLGTTYEWVVTDDGGVSGAEDGSGSSISGTLTNLTNTAKVVSYTVSPTAGTCEGEPFILDVTVKPAPAITPMTATICSGGSFTLTPTDEANGNIVPLGTTYRWSAPSLSTPGGITGGGAGSNAAAISGTLTNTTSAVQTATYWVTPTVGGCDGLPFDVVVTVTPKPAINPMTATICSGGDFDLTPADGADGNVVPAGTTYSWSAPSVTGITGTQAGTDETSISGTLTNTSNTVKIVTYTVTPTSAEGCPGIVFSVAVTVNPTPSIPNTTVTVCSGEAFSISPANGTNGNIVPSGTDYSWGVPVVSGSMTGAAAGSGSSIGGTLTNPTNSTQTATYTVMPTSGSCPGSTFELTVIVNPTPSVTIGDNATICYGVENPDITFTNQVDLPVTVSYTINGGANFTENIAAGGTTVIPAAINQEGTFVYKLVSAVYQSSPTCPAPLTGTATIVVKPITTVAIDRDPAGTICFGESVTFTSNVTDAGTNPAYQWYLNGAALSGETGISFTSATLNNTDKVKLVVTTSDTPCPGAIQSNTVTMTVNPTVVPEVHILESQNPICEGTEVTFTTDLVIGGGTNPTYQWQISTDGGTNWNDLVGETNDSFSSSTLDDGDQVRLELISNALCAANPAHSNEIILFIDPLPTASTAGSAAICVGDSYTLSSGEATATDGDISWSHNGTGTITNGNTTAPTYTPGAVDAGNTVMLTMTVTSDNNCGSATAEGTYAITVYPLPVPTISGDQIVCENATGHVYTTEGGMSDYVWVITGGSVTSGGSSADNTITVSWGPTGTGTVSVNYTSADGCTAALPTAISVSIEPLPNASAGGSQTICENETATVNGASADNGDILWTVTSGNGSLTNETSLSPTYTPGAGDAGSTVRLTMTVTSDNACGTATATANYSIVIDPLPTASAGGSTTICEDGAATVSGASASNGTILWTHNGAGSITAGTETTISPTYNAASGDAGNTVTLTLTVTSNNSCGTATASDTYTIDVDPNLDVSVSVGTLAPVCSGESITLTATPVNEGGNPSYEWFVKGSSVGNNSPTYTYTPLDGDDVYVVLTSDETCTSGNTATSNSVTLQVDEPITETPQLPDGPVSVCSVATVLNYSVPAVDNASYYDWNLPAGWIIASGEGTNAITVNVTGVSPDIYTISVTVSNACSATTTSAPLEITVGDYATADAGADQTICYDEATISISGTPGGAASKNKGTWTSSGSGTFGNIFKTDATYTPSIADRNAGSVTLTFTTDDPSGTCAPATDDLILTIRPELFATISGTETICEGSSSGITFSGEPNSIITYNDGVSDQTIAIGASGSASLNTGSLTATTTYTLVSVDWATEPSCAENVSGAATITVEPLAIVDAGAAQTICEDEIVSLNGTVTIGATAGIWTTNGDGSFDNATSLNTIYTPGANDIASGSVTLSLTSTDHAAACNEVADDVVITINPLPVVDAGTDQTICEGEDVSLSGSVTGAVNTGSWSTNGSGLFDDVSSLNAIYTPSAADIADGSVTLTLTSDDPAGICDVVAADVIITINPLPVVAAGEDQIICENETISLSGSVSGVVSSGSWTSNGSGSFNSASSFNAIYTPSAADISAGSVVLTLTSIDPDGTGPCEPVADEVEISINSLPVVAAGENQIICEGEPVFLNGSISGSATSGIWTSNGSGSFDDETTFNAIYTPSAEDLTAGSVILTLTSIDPDGAGPCDAVWDEVEVTINPLATVDAGAYGPLCQGNSITLSNASIGGGASTAAWSIVSGNGTLSSTAQTSTPETVSFTPAANFYGTVTLRLTTNDPSGPCSSVVTTTTFTVNRAVVITTQPVNTGVCVGQQADLTVAAVGTGLSYQWYKNNSPIPGAESATLHFASVSLTDNGEYNVVVSGESPCSPQTSNTVTLNVDATITITTQPVSQTKCEGENVILNVIADAGGVPLTYQWRKNGTAISGATSSSYTLTNISTADAGNYDVVISGTAGFTCSSVTSTTASLNVNTLGTIALSGNDDQTVCIDKAISTIEYTLGGSANNYELTGSLPAGVTESFSGNVLTLSGTPTETGTFAYTVTTTGSPCNNPSLSGTITVDGNATISLAGGNATPTLCINSPLQTITYLIGGNASGASIVWDAATPAGINGNYNAINGLFTISGTPTAAGTYGFTVTAESGCADASLSGELTITEDATISWTSGDIDQTVCLRTPIEPISYTMGGSATGIVLTGNLPDGVSGSYSGGVYTISGTPLAPGTFNYALTTTGPCQNASETGTITVDYYADGGFISPSIATVCTEINSGTLTLEGYSGNVIQWEQSLDGGNTWTVIPGTAGLDTYNYTNVPSTTLFTALIGNTTCGNVYSSTARITVIPAFTPEITVSLGDLCAGEPVTLTANVEILPDTLGIISGGSFDVANPKGWTVYEDGLAIHPFPAAGNNRENGPWAETNGPKEFCGTIYDTPDNTKFSIVNGELNSWMETPVFSLPATMSSAELTFTHAYHLEPGTTAKIELSTDGGNTYNIVLAQYSGDLNSGNPNVINDVGVDMSAYIGSSDLQIRFNYDGVGCSVWAVDDIGLPTPPADATFEWGPVEEIPGGSGSEVIVVPGTTTEYTLTVYVAGCPGEAKAVWVNVYNFPDVFTTNTCVGGTATFTHNGAENGTWTVSGGGVINSAGEFTASEAGCFVATYETPAGDCSGSANFVVFPVAQVPVVNDGCGDIEVTPPTLVDGFDIEYSFDGGSTWGSSNYYSPPADNCAGYRIKTRYISSALCDPTPVGAISECNDSPEFLRSVDRTAPTFTVPADLTISKDADCNYDASVSVTGDVTDEADNCSTGLNATSEDVVTTGACEGEVIITRYWSLIDDCGNETNHTQVITVADNNEAPTFSAPADITIYRKADCTYDASLSVTGDVNDAVDNCSTVLDIDYSDATTAGDCGGEEIITRTWTVTDDCGNSTSKVQTITVADDIQPTITCPADLTVQCRDDVPAANVSSVSATDNCAGAVTVTHIGDVSDGGTCPEIITRTYRATDVCGNFVECTQKITVDDTTAPTASNPAPITVQCIGDVPAADINVVTDEADNCTATPVVAFVSDVSDGNSCPEVITRTYSVTDDCGNSINVTQTINVGDDVSPTITCPADITQAAEDGECFAINVSLGTPTATDNCSAVSSISLTHDAPAQFPVGETTVTWTATDECGNETTCTQMVTIIDEEKPEISSCPGDQTVNADPGVCGAYVSIESPIAIDPCGVLSIVNDFNGTTDASGIYPVGETTVTWTVTDEAGNFTTCTQVITVIDNQDPIFTFCPSNEEEEIAADQCSKTGVSLGVPTIEDNCSYTLSYTLSGETSGSGNGLIPSTQAFNVGVTTVTYTATDPAGNTATCQFTVTIKRLEIPEAAITCPDDPATVNALIGLCEAPVVVPAPEIHDPCNAIVSVVNDYNHTDNASDTYPVGTTTVTWTITDKGGTTTTCVQTVTVIDAEAPTISCQGDVEDLITNGGCDLVSSQVTAPTFNDNCPDPVLSYQLIMEEGTVINGNGSAHNYPFPVGKTQINYTVTDAAGLTATCSYTVWIKNLDAPQFEVDCNTAIDVTVNASSGLCEADITVPAPDITNPCGEVYSITNDFNGTNDASGIYEVGQTTVIWTIVDASGTVYTCEQTVTVIDAEAPTISCQGDVEDLITNGGCNLVSSQVTAPTFNDNCPDPLLSYQLIMEDGTIINGNGSAHNYPFPVGKTQINYTVTDAAGLIATCSYTVWIKNLADPKFEVDCNTATDVTVNASSGLCEADVTVPAPDITNPCGEVYSITNDFNGTNDASGIYEVGQTTVIWTIVDASGTVYTCEQTVIVIDAEAPTISCQGDVEDLITNGGCDLVSSQVTAPTFNDNCPDPVLSYQLIMEDGTVINGNGSAHNYPFPVGKTQINYTVTDAAGLTATCSYTVWIKNLDAPQFEVDCNTAIDITVNASSGLCEADVSVPAPGITNPCNEAYSIVNDSPYKTSDANASGTYPVGTTTINWLITDASGNEYPCVQTVTVTDLLPTLDCPENITVQADFDLPYASDVPVPSPSYADNCPNPELSWVMSGVTTGSGNGDPSGINLFPASYTFNVGVTTIEYTLTDAHGNTVSCSFTVTVTGPPVIICPTDYPTNTDPNVCTATRSSDDYGLPTLQEGVQPVTWTWTIYNPDGSVGATNSGSLFVGSAGNPGPPDIPDYSFELGTSTIVWRAENRSGYSECSHQVIVTDIEPPVVSCTGRNLEGCDTDVITGPAFSTVTANSSYAEFIDATNQGSATDNCTIDAVEYVDVVDGTCPIVVTRTWTVYDASGNNASCDQTINIDDTTPPTITAPTSRDIEACDVDAALAVENLLPYSPSSTTITLGQLRNEGGDADDNCLLSSVSYIDVTTGSCPWTVNRTFSATDACGNVVTATQVFTITINDTTPPVVTADDDETIEACSVIVGLPSYSETAVTVTGEEATYGFSVVEDCSYGITYVDATVGSCPWVVTRTFTATDGCGNFGTATQTFTIDDTTLPTATAPGEITVEGCDETDITADGTSALSYSASEATISLLQFQTEGGSAADNCNIKSITYFDGTPSGSCPAVVERTFTVTDNCDNQILVTQTITIDDTTNPTASNPAPVTVECAGDVPAVDITVVTDEADNCTAAPVVAWVSDVSDNQTCPETITRTYSVTDDCDNQ
ncbi:HYR domain-containing protein, partial [Sunxiuqinia sp. sy24]|uniref:HYR domain-containing protein n=1 Tax=Sunxiuqinia sp. sy24 TaxID=3461495 RepID=UPI0040466A40